MLYAYELSRHEEEWNRDEEIEKERERDIYGEMNKQAYFQASER